MQSTTQYQICTRCLMDTSDPEIHFHDAGACNHCTDFLRRKAARPKGEERDAMLQKILRDIRERGKGKDYDCLVGLSGGRDSTYVAYLAKKLGLHPLAVHVDNGWDSELAVHNIHETVKALDLDLVTKVLDWEGFRKIQLAMLHSSTPDLELPTDHAIRATMLGMARKHKVHFILNGRNQSTEGIVPEEWSYGPLDWKYMNAVHKKFMGTRMRSYPHLTLPQYVWHTLVYRTKDINILDLVDYEKESATRVLIDELDWREYGDKHFESIWTRFFQGYILPKKFGYDKRRAHLSVLVLNGEITREEGLIMLQGKDYLRDQAEEDKAYAVKKFGLTASEFEQLMASPNKTFRDYPNNSWVFRPKDNPRLLRMLRLAARFRILPPTFGQNLLGYR